MSPDKIKLASIDLELVTEQIGNFIIQSILTHRASGGVIGLSGGVDSTVSAALATKAIAGYNQKHCHKLELSAYILSSKVNSPQDKVDGISIAQQLGIKYQVLNIEPVVETYNALIPNLKKPEAKKDLGNMMSRIRANILSTMAALDKKLVIGTGNRDEDFGIGYFTLFGDGAVHLSPIGNLSKRLVKQLAIHLDFSQSPQRDPTAGLEPGQTDYSDLGYTYELVELVIEGLRQGFKPEELPLHPQVQEMAKPILKNNHKFSSPFEMVEDILNRHFKVALPKAEIIHPPMAPITLNYETK